MSFLDRMDHEVKKNLIHTIKTTDDIEWLATLVTNAQMDYWYDPCGKSGFDINPHLSDISVMCLNRIMRLKKLDGRD